MNTHTQDTVVLLHLLSLYYTYVNGCFLPKQKQNKEIRILCVYFVILWHIETVIPLFVTLSFFLFFVLFFFFFFFV